MTEATAASIKVAGYFLEWELIEEEKRRLADRSKDLFKAMKADDFDTKAARVVFREKYEERHATVGDVERAEEQEVINDLYRAALSTGLALRAQPAHARVENVEQFDAETGELNTKTVVSHSSPSNGQPGGMVPPPAFQPGAHSNPDARTDSMTPSQSRRENARYESASERGRAHLEMENGNTVLNHQTPPASASEVAI